MKIRLYSHAHLPTGYGRAALSLAMALDRPRPGWPQDLGGLELRTIGPRDSDVPWPIPGDMLEVIPNPDAVIVHTLPGDCHRVLELEGLRRGAGPKLVAYTTWEALTAPEAIVQPLFDSFDQVWVPSAITRCAFLSPAHPSRLRVLPHCFDETVERPRLDVESERFRFYWIGAWSARKNPGGLIRAFANAFHAGSRAELVIHSPGCSMDTFVGALAATGLMQAELPTITLSNEHLSDAGIAKLHATSDCFVTAARGEAWNLPAFDAMLAGRHVISQYGLGSDEFLRNTSADLYDGWESPAQVDVTYTSNNQGTVSIKTIGAQGLTSRSLWLEPNLSALADAMRHAFEARRRIIKIDYDVAERFGYAAVAKQALDMLESP